MNVIGNGQLLLQGGLYTLIAALTPVANTLASDATLTTRAAICLVITAIIAGATALKAFLSTTFSDSGAADTKPETAGAVTVPKQELKTRK
jgi:Flp pilus assembly pilin Flp